MRKTKITQHRAPLSKAFWGLFMFAVGVPSALAQSNFQPPSVLPQQNTDLGGYGDACIGLADMIRTGDIHLRQINCFIKYFSQTLVGIAGSLSVIFILIGGYRYIIGSIDEKENAKRTIMNALVGLVVALMAWVFIDIVLRFITE